MDNDEIRRRVREALAERGDVVVVYLYGSRARGTAHAASDVDLGILFSAPLPKTLLGQPYLLEADLSELLGLPVQVVELNDATADLVHRVLRDGELLVERDRSARVRFEVKKRQEYLDLLPVLRAYRRAG